MTGREYMLRTTVWTVVPLAMACNGGGVRNAQFELHDRVIFSIEEDGVLIRKDRSTAKGYRDFKGIISQDELLALEDALP